jgi:hypothetical protein
VIDKARDVQPVVVRCLLTYGPGDRVVPEGVAQWNQREQARGVVVSDRPNDRGQGVLHSLAGEGPERAESEQSQDEPPTDGRTLRVGGCVVWFPDT